MTSLATRIRPTLVALLATVVASFGATATAGTALGASHHHHSRHHPSRKHHSTHHSGIPQGNVGDNDSDNHGGPSDGDGNM